MARSSYVSTNTLSFMSRALHFKTLLFLSRESSTSIICSNVVKNKDLCIWVAQINVLCMGTMIWANKIRGKSKSKRKNSLIKSNFVTYTLTHTVLGLARTFWRSKQHLISNESKIQSKALSHVGAQRLDGVLNLPWFKCSSILKYTSCEGPLRSTECSTSIDRCTHLISKYRHARVQRLDGVLDLKQPMYSNIPKPNHEREHCARRGTQLRMI